MNTRIVVSVITALLIFLFVYTATSKLLDYTSFHSMLAQPPLTGKGAGALAILIPFAELGAGLLLLFSRTRYSGLYASFVLLVLFTSYLGYMILYAPHLPCGCGGVISSMSWKEHIVFNGAFLVLNLIALFLYQKDFYKNVLRNPGMPGTEADGRVEKA